MTPAFYIKRVPKVLYVGLAGMGLMLALSACQTTPITYSADIPHADKHAYMPSKFWCNKVADTKGQYFTDRRRNEGAVRALEFVKGNPYGVYQKSDGRLTMAIFREENSQCVAVRAHSARYRETLRAMAGLAPMQDIRELSAPHQIYCEDASKARVLQDFAGGIVTKQSLDGDGDQLYQYGSEHGAYWLILSPEQASNNKRVCYQAAGQNDALHDFMNAYLSAERIK